MQLRKSLALHHSDFCGRRINVEQSAGGGKKRRSEAIEAKRSDHAEPRLKAMRAPPPLRREAKQIFDNDDISTVHIERFQNNGAIRESCDHISGGPEKSSNLRKRRLVSSIDSNETSALYDAQSAVRGRDQLHNHSDSNGVVAIQQIFRSVATRGRGGPGRGRVFGGRHF
jgi:hypothetical protein